MPEDVCTGAYMHALRAVHFFHGEIKTLCFFACLFVFVHVHMNHCIFMVMCLQRIMHILENACTAWCVCVCVQVFVCMHMHLWYTLVHSLYNCVT